MFIAKVMQTQRVLQTRHLPRFQGGLDHENHGPRSTQLRLVLGINEAAPVTSKLRIIFQAAVCIFLFGLLGADLAPGAHTRGQNKLPSGALGSKLSMQICPCCP